jgi:hypothetical protein
MKDYDREAVFAKTADFIARQARKAIAQRRGPLPPSSNRHGPGWAAVP